MNNLNPNRNILDGDSIIKATQEVWWKWANLQFLKSIESSHFKVPDFITISDFSEWNLQKVSLAFQGKVVAVRSSGIHEDGWKESLAWCFKTVLNVNASNIAFSLNDIHSHSIQKTGEKIPVVVQEMVPSVYSWVLFTYDIDENKPYFVVNTIHGLWESLVSWEETGETFKIFSGADEKNIPDERLKNLFIAAQEIQSHYSVPHIDIEFAFAPESTIPHILQVRPITQISSDSNMHDNMNYYLKLASRYASSISRVLQGENQIYGNMIDINPEELIGNQPPLIRSFFEEIFPKSSLIRWRKELWYWWSGSILEFFAGKPYVSLSKNLEFFLPEGLSQEDIALFSNFFNHLIEQNPQFQTDLDAKLYPNTIEQVENILNITGVYGPEKERILIIFKEFFLSLEDKLLTFELSLDTRLQEIYHRASIICDKRIQSMSDLSDIDFWISQTSHLGELVECIKELTYIFVIVARWAFYFSGKDPSINDIYFRSHKYESSILSYLQWIWKDSFKFSSVEGFNFLKTIHSTYTKENLEKMIETERQDVWSVNHTSRFMVYRENIKYLFSRLFLILGNSVFAEEPEHFSFPDFISCIQDSQERGSIINTKKSHTQARTETRKRIEDILIFPPVMHRMNSPLFLKLEVWSAHFIGSGILEWEIIFVHHVTELENIDIQGKIICIENATPEIDVFLPKIRGIITKNWGPLAHIVIRSREYKIPAVVWLGNDFDKFRKANWNITIDFSTQTIHHHDSNNAT